MKLVVDHQLPMALAIHLRSWGWDCVHVLDRGLSLSNDSEIWAAAAAEGRMVISKDDDFLFLAARPGDAGRLIWVRIGNCRNAALLAAFDRAREALTAAIASGQRVIELR